MLLVLPVLGPFWRCWKMLSPGEIGLRCCTEREGKVESSYVNEFTCQPALSDRGAWMMGH